MKYEQIHSFLSFKTESVSFAVWESAVDIAKRIETLAISVSTDRTAFTLPLNEKSNQAEYLAYFDKYQEACALLKKVKSSALAMSEVSPRYVSNCDSFINICKTLETKFAAFSGEISAIVSKINALPLSLNLPVDVGEVTDLLRDAQMILDTVTETENRGLLIPAESKNHLNKAIKYYNDCLAPYSPNFSGVAIISWKNGVYQGAISKGVPNGLGKLTLADGQVYSGTFVSGVLCGAGSIKQKNGIVYRGDFKDGAFPYGRIQYNNDNTYEGELVNLSPCGKGKYTIKAKGASFEGEFKNGKPYMGSVILKSKVVYKGQVELAGGMNNADDFVYQGKGELFENDGKRYVGEFVNGKKQGEGISYNKDGTVIYDGAWLNGEECPTEEQKSYLSGISHYKSGNWKCALDDFQSAHFYKDSHEYIIKCKEKLKEEEKKDIGNLILSLLIQIVICCGALTVGYWLIALTDQCWYTPIFALGIVGILHLTCLPIAKLNKHRVVCRVIYQIVVYACIICLSLINDFPLVNIIFTLIAAAFTANMSGNGNKVKLPVLRIIVTVVCMFGLILVEEYFVPFMIAKSFWHTLWIAPLCGGNIMFCVIFSMVGNYDEDDDTYLNGILTGFISILAVIIRTIVLICSLVGFGFGMFWYIVLFVMVSIGGSFFALGAGHATSGS